MASSKEKNIPERLKEKIRQLWRSPSFHGAFTGLANFHVALKDKNIMLSKEKLFHIMSEDQDFILETKKRRKRLNRRKMIVHGFGRLWQADLGDMPSDDGYKSFLCCVDIFSRNIYCRALKSKTGKAVQQKFREIFAEVHLKPEKIETDRGVEFLSNKAFFQKNNIFFKTKTGANKAAFAEHAIQVRYVKSSVLFFKLDFFSADGQAPAISPHAFPSYDALGKIFRSNRKRT